MATGTSKAMESDDGPILHYKAVGEVNARFGDFPRSKNVQLPGFPNSNTGSVSKSSIFVTKFTFVMKFTGFTTHHPNRWCMRLASASFKMPSSLRGNHVCEFDVLEFPKKQSWVSLVPKMLSHHLTGFVSLMPKCNELYLAGTQIQGLTWQLVHPEGNSWGQRTGKKI